MSGYRSLGAILKIARWLQSWLGTHILVSKTAFDIQVGSIRDPPFFFLADDIKRNQLDISLMMKRTNVYINYMKGDVVSFIFVWCLCHCVLSLLILECLCCRQTCMQVPWPSLQRKNVTKMFFEGFFWGGGWLGDYIKTLPNSQYVIIIDGNKNRWVGWVRGGRRGVRIQTFKL